MENQSNMKFRKMNKLFLKWIARANKTGDDDFFFETSPENCDREFLLIYIRFFQPTFTDDEFLSFGDIVLKVKSMIIYSEREYPHTAPYNGKIYWNILNPSDTETKVEFEWLHESGALESDESYTGFEDLPECDWEELYDTDEDDDLIVDNESVNSEESESEHPFDSEIRDILYDNIREILKSMSIWNAKIKTGEKIFKKTTTNFQ